MEWLDLGLPHQAAFTLERQRRELRACNNPAVLRAAAMALIQEVHHLQNVNRQLMTMVGRLEVDRAMAGGLPAPSDKHMDWAREILASLGGLIPESTSPAEA